MRSSTAIILTLALLTPVVAVAGEEACTDDPMECARHINEMAEGRGWLGIQFDGEPYGAARLAWVVPGSPAEKAGLRAGDRPVKLNGVPYAPDQQEKLQAEYEQFVPGKTITLVVERAGEEVTVRAELVAVPDHIVAQWVGQHMMKHLHQVDAEAARKVEGGDGTKVSGGGD